MQILKLKLEYIISVYAVKQLTIINKQKYVFLLYSIGTIRCSAKWVIWISSRGRQRIFVCRWSDKVRKIAWSSSSKALLKYYGDTDRWRTRYKIEGLVFVHFVKKLNFDKFSDLCQSIGKYRGQAQSKCNMIAKQKQNDFVPFVFPFQSRYDSHLSFEKLVARNRNSVKLDVIPKTK